MRLKPYTAIGLRRKACVRCGAPAATQWQICADARQFRPFCSTCDVELNELVMRWIWGGARETDLEIYRQERLG